MNQVAVIFALLILRTLASDSREPAKRTARRSLSSKAESRKLASGERTTKRTPSSKAEPAKKVTILDPNERLPPLGVILSKRDQERKLLVNKALSRYLNHESKTNTPDSNVAQRTNHAVVSHGDIFGLIAGEPVSLNTVNAYLDVLRSVAHGNQEHFDTHTILAPDFFETTSPSKINALSEKVHPVSIVPLQGGVGEDQPS